MRARRHTLAMLLTPFLVSACEKDRTISFEQFVNTTVELRKAATQTNTPAAFDARKRAIEAKQRVTDADLNGFLRKHARDVKLLSAAWDSVEARLGRAGARDAATRPTPGPPVTITPGTPPTGRSDAAGAPAPGPTPPHPGPPRF